MCYSLTKYAKLADISKLSSFGSATQTISCLMRLKGENTFINCKQPTLMLITINPKLPMRNKAITRDFYCSQLGFEEFGSADFEGYLMVQKDQIQIHFFEFPSLNPKENYGQVYIRTEAIAAVYKDFLNHNIIMHPAGHLQAKPWGQLEFSILDPDHNVLTFGQSL